MKELFKPEGIAVIGCGRIAESVHIRNLAKMRNARVVALADLDAAALKRASASAPGAALFADVRAALQHPSVNAALICVPPAQHAATASLALELQKHVYVEKPLAAELNEACALMQSRAGASRVRMIGFNFRFNKNYLKLKHSVQQHAVEDIIAVRSVFSSPSNSVPLWKQKAETGGGVLLDLASHHFDLIPYLLGSRIREVSANIWSHRWEEDNAFVHWQLENGIRIESFFSMNGPEEDRIEVYTRSGKLVADRFRQGLLQPLSRSGYEPSYRTALQVFVDSIRSNRAPSPSFSDGLEALLAVYAARRSHIQGTPALLKDTRSENLTHQ